MLLLHSHSTSLGSTCTADPSFEPSVLTAAACRVVLVRYREDYTWAQQLAKKAIPHVIYNKGEPYVTPGVCEHPLWNHGTEAHGYLHDLILHAHHPARWTLFAQTQRGCRWTSPAPKGSYGEEVVMNAIDHFCSRDATDDEFDFAWISAEGTQLTVHGWHLFSDRIIRQFVGRLVNASYTLDKVAVRALRSLLQAIAQVMSPRPHEEHGSSAQMFSPCAAFAVRDTVLKRINLATIQELFHLGGFDIAAARCPAVHGQTAPRCVGHFLERTWPMILGSNAVSFMRCATLPCSSAAAYNLSSLMGAVRTEAQ